MAKIIAIMQMKGGATKTTTSINILGALLESGKKTLLCDMDKDKPDAMLWVDFGQQLNKHVIPLFEENPKIVINDIINDSDYDYIILDTPPNMEAPALKAAMIADFIIIPCQPTELDKSSLSSASSAAMMADKPFYFLPSRIFNNTKTSRHLVKDLGETNNCFNSKIYNSVDMIECQRYGTWIGEYKPDHKNHIEFRKLVKEIENLK